MMDAKIKPIIAKLNASGIHTKYSCEGHKSVKGLHIGYILFAGRLSKDRLKEAKDILHENGVNRVVHKVKRYSGGSRSYVEFKPLE